MKLRTMVGALLVLAMAGCGRHTLSGTYTASGPQAAVMLQLTERSDHRLMGTLSAVQITAAGDAQRMDFSITDGSVDASGRAISLTMKPNGLFGQTRTVSGEVTPDGMSLAMPDGVLQLASGTMEGFERASRALDVAAADRKRQLEQQKSAENDLNLVAALLQEVSGYDQRIASNTQGPDDVRKDEEALVAAARRSLATERRLTATHREFDASQAQFAVGQASFRLNLIRLQVQEDVRTGHQHIADLDRSVANNPCTHRGTIPGCVALAGELTRYQATRAKVLSELEQLSKDLATNEAAMDTLNKAAGN